MSSLTDDQLDSWNAIFAPAAQSASDAIARWTNGRMRLELDDAREIGLDELHQALPQGESPATMVVVEISGDFGGQLLLVFEERSASAMVESLLRRQADDVDAWGELEWSALRETGNIFASAFVSSIRAFAAQEVLLPAPPVIVRDYVSGVLEQAVLPQLMSGDALLFCQTRMTREGEPIAFTSLFVPSPQLVEALRGFLMSSATRKARGNA